MSHQDSFDHRSVDSKSQDPTSMTIEFLRARLLAERAVSKSARAKLDGLSDKVAELEEQLKIVSLQRKKAEQATADILAILEENGFTDVSDAYDDASSNSDQESYSRSNSGSGRSITWRGRRREPCSSDKVKESSRNRRHRGFGSASFSSPRLRQGRSCRQIRRCESRTESEDRKRDVNPVEFQENGVLADSLEEASSRAVVGVDVAKRDESLRKKSNSNGLVMENSTGISLERALENRAQVIGSFEDMEETQKEWEKKFRENKSSAPDVSDMGNHSDVTDESNGEKPQPQLQESTVRDTRCMIAKAIDSREPFETLSHGSPDNSVTSPDNCCRSCGSKSMEQDAFPSGDKGEHISESPTTESSHPQRFKGIREHSPSVIRSTPVTQRGCSVSGNATTIQKVDYPLAPREKEKTDTCDTVLTALKQAKLSLLEKANSLHIKKPSESSYTSTPSSYALPIEPAFGTTSTPPASTVGAMVEFPVGCAGLFRVPADFSLDASRRNNFLASSSQKALVSHIPERDIPLVPGDQLCSRTSTKSLFNASFQRQLLDTSPPVSTGDRLLTTPYIGGPKLWTGIGPDTQPSVDALKSGLCKGTPSASGSGISGYGGSQVSSTRFELDRQASMYTPMPSTQSFYPDSVLRNRELYSTPYYTRPVGLPPTVGSDDRLPRRI